jgi:hypothetical protein
LYLPILTVLSANASITGKPAIVFTENKLLDRSSDTSNNLPLFPSTAKIVELADDPEPTTLSTSAEDALTRSFAPSKVKPASATAALEDPSEVSTRLFTAPETVLNPAP